MRWFGKLTDRGDMGGLDGLVTNENKLVSVSLRRLCLTTIWRRLSSWAELTYITALDTYIHQKKNRTHINMYKLHTLINDNLQLSKKMNCWRERTGDKVIGIEIKFEMNWIELNWKLKNKIRLLLKFPSSSSQTPSVEHFWNLRNSIFFIGW